MNPRLPLNRGRRKLTASGIKKSESLGMFRGLFLAKEDRLLTDRCSSSTHGHVLYLSLPRSSMRSTNRIMSPNHRSCLQTLSLIQVGRVDNLTRSYCSYGTDAYDVNVSPDKRTILLHDQARLLESLRVSPIVIGRMKPNNQNRGR